MKNLKVLDLSGNDFSMLPTDLWKLSNLEQLYLNNDKNLKLDENIFILGKLPKLKELHLEDDNLKTLPNDIKQLKNLESLYLNKNKFQNIPSQIRTLEHLQYLDLGGNKIKTQNIAPENYNFGFKIHF